MQAASKICLQPHIRNHRHRQIQHHHYYHYYQLPASKAAGSKSLYRFRTIFDDWAATACTHWIESSSTSLESCRQWTTRPHEQGSWVRVRAQLVVDNLLLKIHAYRIGSNTWAQPYEATFGAHCIAYAPAITETIATLLDSAKNKNVHPYILFHMPIPQEREQL